MWADFSRLVPDEVVRTLLIALIAGLASACAPQPSAPIQPSPAVTPEPEPDDPSIGPELDEDRSPSPAANHQDWREARAAIIRGSPNPPERPDPHEHALYSLLPDNPTPEQAQLEGAEHCTWACTNPHNRARTRALFTDHDHPVVEALRLGEPIQIGWTSTSPLVILPATIDHDLRDEPLLYTTIHVIDGEDLVRECLHRLGRDASLTYERSCTEEEQAVARSRRNPPPRSSP